MEEIYGLLSFGWEEISILLKRSIINYFFYFKKYFIKKLKIRSEVKN